MIYFLCDTKDIKKCFTLLTAIHKKSWRTPLPPTLEITLTDGKVQLAAPGGVFHFKCDTRGTAKATLDFRRFASILEHHTMDKLRVEFYEEALRFGIVQVQAKTAFFQNDKILRTIQLPNKYTDMDLLLLKRENYTFEELEFNNLILPILGAEKRIYYQIRRAAMYLRKFGITPAEVKKLVTDKLNVELDLDKTAPQYLLSNSKKIEF